MTILVKDSRSVRHMASENPRPSQGDLISVYRSQADTALGHAENAPSRELKELYLRVAECWCTLVQFETLARGAHG